MSVVAEIKKETNFKYFSVLPREIQMMFIENMEVDDRCRFTRCSQLCGKLVKKSKNLVYELSMNAEVGQCVDVKVQYSDSNPVFGFTLRFVEEVESGERFIKYLKSDGTELWRVEIMEDTYFVELAVQDFKNRLCDYQHTIKSIIVYGVELQDYWNDTNFEIEQLNNLKMIEIDNNINIDQFMTKLHHPLDDLKITGNADRVFEMHPEKVYQVQDKLFLYFFNVNKEQFLRLSARNIEINVGKLSEQDIFDIISCWQNGTIGNEVKYLHWGRFGWSRFDEDELIKLFGGDDLSVERPFFSKEIKHNITGKIGELFVNNHYVQFDVLD